MMKLEIGEQFKKTGLVIAIEIVGTLVIAGLLIFGLILPKYQSWRKVSTENKETAARLEKVGESIEALSKVKTASLKDWKESLARVLPSEEDPLRFASLAENVAAASGVKLSAFQVQLGGSKKATATSPAPSAVNSPVPSAGTGAVSGGASALSRQKAAVGQTGLVVKLSFGGSYQQVIDFLANLEKADRSMVITSLNLSAGGEERLISASLDLTLPLYPKVAAASAENFVPLTSTEEKFIKDLLAKLEISASPAKEPLGKVEPFR